MNKIALVTGGSRGIGLGIAHSLALAGFDLAINGVRAKSLAEQNLHTLQTKTNRIVYCQGNISDEIDRTKIIDQVKSEFGRIDILVNNAGIAPKVRADLLSMSIESYDDVMNTNLKGPLFLTQSTANWMISLQKELTDYHPMIINISSISATVASVMRGEYCISKAGISMMTQLFAVRLAEHNIPVYEVRPGIIASDMTSTVKAKYDKLIDEGLTLIKRWGQPDDIGKAVASIATGAFPYTTGQVFMVDGGMLVDRL
jgi:NAD(P)-dependent dehydrogenase (short-subunit alcohol dehydrogenase family)